MIQLVHIIGNDGGGHVIEAGGVVIDGGDEIINDKGIDFLGVDDGISSGDIVIAY